MPASTLAPAKRSIFTTDDGRNLFITFALVTSLFFIWGFCNGLIEMMDKHFQSTLSLTKAQSSMVQFANFTGYFCMAIPSGLLVKRYGYKGGILIGLGLISLGALWFVPAINIGRFWAFLVGLFVIATGLTCLETIANPYTTVLGSQNYAATRINIAQSFNGIGAMSGPLIGGTFIFSQTSVSNTSNQSLYVPYVGIAVVVALMIVVFWRSNIPEVKAEDDYHLDDSVPTETPKSIWTHPHFVLAVVAQFFYVGAQAGIFSFFANYITQDIPALSAAVAGHLPTAWTYLKDGQYFVTDFGSTRLFSLGGLGLFLIGRFLGSALLRVFSAHLVLGVFAALDVVACLLVFMNLGWVSVGALFAAFFLMSIMFPTIFALGIHGLGSRSKIASSFIVMAIVGGALLPFIMGSIADSYHSMAPGFVMPLVCFVVVALYGFLWPRLSRSEGIQGSAVTNPH